MGVKVHNMGSVSKWRQAGALSGLFLLAATTGLTVYRTLRSEPDAADNGYGGLLNSEADASPNGGSVGSRVSETATRYLKDDGNTRRLWFRDARVPRQWDKFIGSVPQVEQHVCLWGRANERLMSILVNLGQVGTNKPTLAKYGSGRYMYVYVGSKPDCKSVPQPYVELSMQQWLIGPAVKVGFNKDAVVERAMAKQAAVAAGIPFVALDIGDEMCTQAQEDSATADFHMYDGWLSFVHLVGCNRQDSPVTTNKSMPACFFTPHASTFTTSDCPPCPPLCSSLPTIYVYIQPLTFHPFHRTFDMAGTGGTACLQAGCQCTFHWGHVSSLSTTDPTVRS